MRERLGPELEGRALRTEEDAGSLQARWPRAEASPEAAEAWAWLGRWSEFQGRDQEAEERYRRAWETLRSAAEPHWKVVAANTAIDLGWLLQSQGRSEEAARLAEQVAGDLERAGDNRAARVGFFTLGMWCGLWNPEMAVGLLDRGLALKVRGKWMVAELAREKAACLRLLGRAEEADEAERAAGRKGPEARRKRR